jgi:hypothetical protein
MVLHQGDSTMKKILILLSNPKNSVQLRLGEEIREIKEALKQSKNREQFEIVSESAVRVKDLRRALLEYEPAIVHFSGHGSGSDGLILENDSGETQLVSSEALAKLFKQFQQEVQCVVLNACYSEEQAQAIHQYIDCVVGMKKAVGDVAAINFSTAFYEALGAGKSYDKCFNFACNAIDLEGIPESDTPQIRYRPRHYISDIQETQQAKNTDNSSSQPSFTPAININGNLSNSPVSQARRDANQTSHQSQSFGDVSFRGTGNNFNPFNRVHGNVNIDQSKTETIGANSELQAALNELKKLKQEIASTNSLSVLQKKQAEIPVEILETELKKPQPNKSLIDEAVEALKKGLEGVEMLAEPVMKVAAILAKVWV